MDQKSVIISICFALLSSWVLNAAQAQTISTGFPLADIAQGIPFKNVGPDIFSGRVVDLDVNPENPTNFIVAFATSGLWETKNNGRSFTELFAQQSTGIIGDVAVDWTRKHIWVGTGENNSSRSSYAGDGVYLSTDWGKTWTNTGLKNTQHIGRIVFSENDENTVIVAALGALYTKGGERGLFRTTDYGKTWNAVLATTEDVGAIDLISDPNDSKTFYASTWQRDRRAWNFRESGPESAIYKSSDEGKTWQRVSTKSSGFLTGEGTGRIGLSASSKDGKTTLFAVVDNQNRRPETKEDKDKLTLTDLGKMSTSDFVSRDEKQLKQQLTSLGFPLKRYPFDSIKTEIKANRLSPKLLEEYLTDANSLLFNTPVVGAEVYRSDNNGVTWTKTNTDYIDDLYYSYGYYFGQIGSHPLNPDEIYIFGVSAIRSDDGGKTWKSINEANMHADHHAIWINPQECGHVILGNDGGVNISYDYGETYNRVVSPPAAQFYAVNVDNAEPYNVYGGTQDNGVWKGPSTFKAGPGWEMYGNTSYKHIYGGDGMQVEIDPRDNKTVYTGLQFGNYARLDPDGSRTRVKPQHKLGERPLRFNWQTPVHLSIHQPDVFYIGSNKFHRSLNKGENYDISSEDLTKGGRRGDVPFGTISTLDESPLRFGYLYVGTDDGLVHVTRDGGYTWTEITEGLPQDKWVTRVQASKHTLDRVYVSLNNYRNDDFTPYLFVSENGGDSWKSISNGLPAGAINDILEDKVQPDLLYVATDMGMFYSYNRGASWSKLGNLPLVPVHDLVIQEREQDLVVGTHGRSIFIGDLSHLRSLPDSVGQKKLYAYQPAETKWKQSWGNSRSRWNPVDTPLLHLPVFTADAGMLELTVQDSSGKTMQSFSFDAQRGLNYIPYSLSITEQAAKRMDDTKEPADNGMFYLVPARYHLQVKRGSASAKTWLTITEE